MFGKHFESMYEGSMRGSGSAFFAVWGYVISHMRPSHEHGATVELNTEIIGFLIGENVEVVEQQIARMCNPDPKSRTKDEEGRKLVKIGEYLFRVVNGAKYRAIRNAEKRKEQVREAQQRYRSKRAVPHGTQLKGEAAFLKAEQAGATDAQKDNISDSSLPTPDQLRNAFPDDE
jgi:hypothetical protein